jgi:putative 4-mercaptohistidine N1-methyltranferase
VTRTGSPASAMSEDFYETDAALSQYLLFHYGTAEEILPYPGGPREALFYPVRCVTECLDQALLPPSARALDLGCAVGRSSFELGRLCGSVLGIDFSSSFITAARKLQTGGSLRYRYQVEGDRFATGRATAPDGVDLSRVAFETGDATRLPDSLGAFDVVLMANLIDRLAAPMACLQRLPDLLNPGGQLILTSPYTWSEEYTPNSAWLTRLPGNETGTTFGGLSLALGGAFELITRKNLPFLIREHARKFQWSMAEATIWRRRA